MKANTKSILIGSVVVALLIVAAAYKFIYSADVEKAEQIQGDINTLEVRKNELNEKVANRTRYESRITDSEDIIKTVLSLYGPGNTPEKTIMLIVDMCQKLGIEIPSASFADNSLIYSSETVDENGNPDIKIFKSGLSMNLSAGYTQLKKFMDYVNTYPERMNVENFSAGYDAGTGKLTLSLNINMYSVEDKDHEYIAPVIEDIELGTDNIFRTFEKPVEEEVEEGTGANEAAESNNTETSETTDAESLNTIYGRHGLSTESPWHVPYNIKRHLLKNKQISQLIN